MITAGKKLMQTKPVDVLVAIFSDAGSIPAASTNLIRIRK